MAFNGWAGDGTNVSTPGTVTAGTGGAGGSFYAADGTALLPAYSFTAEPTLGFWRNGAASIRVQGALSTTGSLLSGATLGVGAGSSLAWTADAFGSIAAPANGQFNFRNNANSAGVGIDVTTDSTLKVRTRAQADTAIVDASRFSVQGAGGVVTFGPAAVVSITVRGGIITAIS